MKAEDLFEKVTADLVAAIEDGAKDWRMPWHRLGAGTARAAQTVAHTAAGMRWCWRWSPPIAGGRRRPGRPTTRGSVTARRFAGASVARRSFCGSRPSDTRPPTTAATRVHRSLFARAFTVFAAEQVDGAERVSHADRRDERSAADRGRRDLLRQRSVRRGARRRSGVLRPCARPHPPSAPSPVRRGRATTTRPRHTSTPTGPDTPTGSGVTSRAGSATTRTVPRSSSPSWARPSGVLSSNSPRQLARTTPPTSATGWLSCRATRGHSLPRADMRSERSTISTLLLAGHRPAARPTSSSRPRRESRRRCEGGPPPGLGGGPRPPTGRRHRGRLRGPGSEPGRVCLRSRNRTTRFRPSEWCSEWSSEWCSSP